MKTMKVKWFSLFSASLTLSFVVLILVLASCGDSTSYSGCRVIYHVGEGRGVPPFPQIVAPGNIIELPTQEAMTHPTGKVLSGWSAGGTTYPPYARYIVYNDVDFTAQWMATTNTHTVSFDLGEGSGAAPASVTVASGTTINLPSQGAMIAPGGKQFDCWRSGGVSYYAGAPYYVNGNVSFTAQWRDKSYDPDEGSGTPGLAFELINNRTSYRVKKGTITGGEVNIPAYYNGLPVTEIGSPSDWGDEGAFSGTSITRITIPTSVISIGSFAFARCRSLTGVTIPAGLTTISEGMFFQCESLTSVIIPTSVASIGNQVFPYCTGLTTISIPAGVTFIGDGTFSGCTNLTNIEISQSNPNYASEGGMLFSKDKTVLIAYPSASGNAVIPSTVTIIGESAFENSARLTGITIPSSVTFISDHAFFRCRSLTSVTVPASVTTIGRAAFSQCENLTSVTIPASVMSIRDEAFSGCESLASIIISQGNPNYASEGGILFNKDKTVLIAYPSAKYSVTIPTGVTIIGEGAFAGYTSLTGVTIPASVTSIGREAFTSCRSITSITIPASVTSIGNFAFSYWIAGQTINIQGHASQASADAAWGMGWRSACDAVIRYWNGSAWV
jgi:hypothetical protein